MLKIAEVKLSSCGLEVADFRKISIAELWLRNNISLKSCGIVIGEVLPSSCEIAIADSKKLHGPTSAGQTTNHFKKTGTWVTC